MSGRVSVRVPRSYSSRNKGAFSVVDWPSKKLRDITRNALGLGGVV